MEIQCQGEALGEGQRKEMAKAWREREFELSWGTKMMGKMDQIKVGPFIGGKRTPFIAAGGPPGVELFLFGVGGDFLLVEGMRRCM